MSESATGSAPPGSWTYATARSRPSAAHTGASWLWSEQQTTGSPPSESGVRLAGFLLGMDDRMLERRVRELHHVRACLRGQLEPAREVRVEDVEAAGSELEVEGLDVHEHVVPERNRPRQLRIGDARPPVDLEPDEAVVSLPDLP